MRYLSRYAAYAYRITNIKEEQRAKEADDNIQLDKGGHVATTVSSRCSRTEQFQVVIFI